MGRKKKQIDIFSDLSAQSILPKIKTKKQKGRGCGASCEAPPAELAPSRASAEKASSRASAEKPPAEKPPAPSRASRASASRASAPPAELPPSGASAERASKKPPAPSGEPAERASKKPPPPAPSRASRAPAGEPAAKAKREAKREAASAASPSAASASRAPSRVSKRASPSASAENAKIRFGIIQNILKEINESDMLEYITVESNKKYIHDLYKKYIDYLKKNKSIYSRLNYYDSLLNYDSLFKFLISQDSTYWSNISQLKNTDIFNDEVNNLFNQKNYETLNSKITIDQFKEICIVIRNICRILLNTAYSNSLSIIYLLSTSEDTQLLERCKQGIIQMIEKLIKKDKIKEITDDSINELAKLRLEIIKERHPVYA